MLAFSAALSSGLPPPEENMWLVALVTRGLVGDDGTSPDKPTVRTAVNELLALSLYQATTGHVVKWAKRCARICRSTIHMLYENCLLHGCCMHRTSLGTSMPDCHADTHASQTGLRDMPGAPYGPGVLGVVGEHGLAHPGTI